jgi:hypothetical protein
MAHQIDAQFDSTGEGFTFWSDRIPRTGEDLSYNGVDYQVCGVHHTLFDVSGKNWPVHGPITLYLTVKNPEGKK